MFNIHWVVYFCIFVEESLKKNNRGCQYTSLPPTQKKSSGRSCDKAYTAYCLLQDKFQGCRPILPSICPHPHPDPAQDFLSPRLSSLLPLIFPLLCSFPPPPSPLLLSVGGKKSIFVNYPHGVAFRTAKRERKKSCLVFPEFKEWMDGNFGTCHIAIETPFAFVVFSYKKMHIRLKLWTDYQLTVSRAPKRHVPNLHAHTFLLIIQGACKRQLNIDTNQLLETFVVNYVN